MKMTIKEEEGEEEEGEEQIGEEEEGEEEEGGEEEGKEEGEEEGGQESGCKYWPLGQSLVRLLACSHRSLICLLHTRTPLRLFARSVAHSLPSLWESERFDVLKRPGLAPQCASVCLWGEHVNWS